LLTPSDESRSARGSDIYDVNVVADTVALVSIEGDSLAVMRPNGAAVQELALGELLDIRAGGVVIELCVLITALILQEDECAA
jgi:hypothetical protein